jgi:hypothetical protein
MSTSARIPGFEARPYQLRWPRGGINVTANMMRKVLRFSAPAWLFVPAVAQFEISPDHFDEPLPVEISRPAKPQADIHSKIREQQQLLEGYNAQIKAKSLEIDAALEDLSNNGNEAGQAEAGWIHQRELEKLNKELALPISQAQARLASLTSKIASDGQASKARPGERETNMRSTAIGSNRHGSPALTAALTEAR